jgi:hypothetical protein
VEVFVDGLPDVGHPAFQTFANLALVGERSQFRREFVGHRQDALLHDHEDGGPALLHHRGLDQFALAGVELQAAQFRAEHHVGQRRLGIARGCLADHRTPLGQLVVKHGVGRRHVHQSVAHDENAGLVQPVDVLGALVAVARVIGLVHQNGAFAHTFNSCCFLPDQSGSLPKPRCYIQRDGGDLWLRRISSAKHRRLATG